MANFLTKLMNVGSNNQIASGGGGALVSQANLSNLNPGNIMKAYNAATEAGNIQQLPDIPIPKIERPYPATEKEALDATQAAEVLKEGVKNLKTVLKAVGKMEDASAQAVEAMADYNIAQRDAEIKKQCANVKNAMHAAQSGTTHQQLAQDLIAAREREVYRINQIVDTYQKVSGW